ncbi:hypothetical protein ElyMa_005877900 [Elysia marginata]|uniref:Uncharacterized protein n=1 Tax=Elysia marginata TaxID=1093978 RepID=A0AAV4G2R0_9GAST|nr:hypothetical protein ElyMa_005877900 [Elysia marginata]
MAKLLLLLRMVLAVWTFFGLTGTQAQSGAGTTSLLRDLLKYSRQELQQQPPVHHHHPNVPSQKHHHNHQQRLQLRSEQQQWKEHIHEPALMQPSGQPIPIVTKQQRSHASDPLYAYPIPPWYLYYWFMENYN